MTERRLALRLEPVEDRCLPSVGGWDHRPPAPAFAAHHRGEPPADWRPGRHDAPGDREQRDGGPTIQSGGLVMAVPDRPPRPEPPTVPVAALRAVTQPPRPPVAVREVVAGEPATRPAALAADAPMADGNGPAADLPAAASPPAVTARPPAAEPAPPAAPTAPGWLGVGAAVPATGEPLAEPSPGEIVLPGVEVDLPPAVTTAAAVAREVVAAAAPLVPLVPLAGVVPVDLVAVERAAADLLAGLAGVTAADTGPVGLAVVLAGGLAHALRPAADRRAAAVGNDSALARWETRHDRRPA
jgi:hypothetical protein